MIPKNKVFSINGRPLKITNVSYTYYINICKTYTRILKADILKALLKQALGMLWWSHRA